MNPNIKTIDIIAKEWFDKAHGNSYFSARVTINFGMKTKKTILLPFQYGYGNHYIDISFKALQDEGIIPEQDNGNPYWRFFEDNNIIARYSKYENCKKRDVKNWGIK